MSLLCCDCFFQVLTTSAPGNIVRDGLNVLAVERVPEQIGCTVAAVPLVRSVVAVCLAVAVQLLGDTQPSVVAQEVAQSTGRRVWFVVVHQVWFDGHRGEDRRAESLKGGLVRFYSLIHSGLLFLVIDFPLITLFND